MSMVSLDMNDVTLELLDWKTLSYWMVLKLWKSVQGNLNATLLHEILLWVLASSMHRSACHRAQECHQIIYKLQCKHMDVHCSIGHFWQWNLHQSSTQRSSEDQPPQRNSAAPRKRGPCAYKPPAKRLNFEQNPDSSATVAVSFMISLILMHGGHDYMFLYHKSPLHWLFRV